LEARSLGEEPRDREILDESELLMERLVQLEEAAANR